MSGQVRTVGAELAVLAARQHGVVSFRQLRELGYARNTILGWARAGRLHRLHRGVYAVGHDALTWNGHCMAAVLAATPAVASHWTAAWLWGLLRQKPAKFDITTRRRRSGQREFVVHFGALSREDVTRREGIPVTSMARTLLDLAPLVPPHRLARYLDRLEDTRDFDLRRIESLLDRSAGHRGRQPLQAALRTYRPKVATLRSDLERRFRELVEAAGLPLPATNFNVGAYELDCYWEAERFAVELDVYATHGSRLAFEDDRERADDLLLLGVEMTRVTGLRLAREPDEVITRLAAHLDRRRSQLLRIGS